MYKREYRDLILEDGEYADIEAYLEEHSMEWKVEAGSLGLGVCYSVVWENMKAASGLFLHMVARGVEFGGLEKSEGVKRYWPFSLGYTEPRPVEFRSGSHGGFGR